MKRFSPLIKTILYPALLLLVHGIAENWGELVKLLGPHWHFLSGPVVVGIGGLILHQMESPTKG